MSRSVAPLQLIAAVLIGLLVAGCGTLPDFARPPESSVQKDGTEASRAPESPDPTTTTKPDPAPESLDPPSTTEPNPVPVPSASTASPREPPGPGPSKPSSSPPTNSDHPEPGGPAVIAWVPFGPASPTTPEPPERWYGYLAAMLCDDALIEVEGSDYELATYAAYAGAGHACKAIQNGDQKAWDRAAEYLELAGEGGLKPCLDKAVLQVLKNLVAAHKADPDRKIELAKPHSSIHACDFSIEKMNPNAGPSGRGYSHRHLRHRPR